MEWGLLLLLEVYTVGAVVEVGMDGVGEYRGGQRHGRLAACRFPGAVWAVAVEEYRGVRRHGKRAACRFPEAAWAV